VPEPVEELKEEEEVADADKQQEDEAGLDSPLASPLTSALPSPGANAPSPSPLPFDSLERFPDPSLNPVVPSTTAAAAMLEEQLPLSEAQHLKRRIDHFEKALKHSPLQSIRESEKKEREKRSSKPKELDLVGSESVVPQEIEIPMAQIMQPEVVLSVGLYRPGRLTKIQEYLVLGSQKLTALRDKLYCLSDLMLDGPDTKSGYFFIENVFYNDARASNALDYSEFDSLFLCPCFFLQHSRAHFILLVAFFL